MTKDRLFACLLLGFGIVTTATYFAWIVTGGWL